MNFIADPEQVPRPTRLEVAEQIAAQAIRIAETAVRLAETPVARERRSPKPRRRPTS